MRSFLDGIAYQVGERHRIRELFADNSAPTFDVEFYTGRGLENFCCQKADTMSVCTEVISDTLHKSRLSARQIDAAIIDNATWDSSRDEEFALFAGLRAAGIRDIPVVGLAMQACSGLATALELGSLRINSINTSTFVLVLTSGRVLPGRNRIGANTGTIYSDGLATCILSPKESGFELLATTSHTNLTDTSNTPTGREHADMMRGHANLSITSNKLYSLAGIDPSQISALFCTNGSMTYNMIAADAARISNDRVYSDDLARNAHVHSCDHLIGLENYGKLYGHKPDSIYLLLGWSPYVFSGALIRYVGQKPDRL